MGAVYGRGIRKGDTASSAMNSFDIENIKQVGTVLGQAQLELELCFTLFKMFYIKLIKLVEQLCLLPHSVQLGNFSPA